MRKESLQKFIGNDYKKCVYLSVEIGLILFFVATLFMFIADSPFAIWNDEVWSIKAYKGTFVDIVSTYSHDLYPPMEGVLRKIFAYLFTGSLFSMKAFSIIPTILTMAFMFLFLKKEFSDKVAIIFLLSFCASKPIIHFSTEIRMYTWALFFISMLIPTSWYIVKTSKIKWWCLFAFSAVCAAYTHYYAALNAAIVYLFLLIYMFVKDRKQTKKALMTGVLCTIVYLPWVSIAFSSFAKISKGFWIAPITIKTVFYWLIYPFVLTSWRVQADDIMYIGVYIIALVIFLCKSRTNKKVLFAFTGLICAISLISISLVVSLCTTTPIITDRYLFCSFSLVFFFIAVVIGSVRYRVVYLTIAALLFSIVVYRTVLIHRSYLLENKNYEDAVNFLNNNVRSDDIFVFDRKAYPGSHLTSVFAFLFPKNRQFDIDTFLSPPSSTKFPVNFWLVAIPDEILQHDASLKSCGTFQIHEMYRYDVSNYRES